MARPLSEVTDAQACAPALLPVVADWFAAKGWAPRRHQLDMLAAARRGRNALLVAATGAGKTLAGFLPTIIDLAQTPADGLHTLYVSPLKALAVDVQRNLLTPIEEMGLPIRVETRTGDTPADRKARQRVRPPQILLTTPESLSLLLSHEDSAFLFAGLKTIVIDEVHAFATGKRGDLLSLALARLQKLAPGLRRVALSATVSDPEAYQGWLAPHADVETVDLVLGDPGAEAEIAIMLPEDERIPWSGHSGRWATENVMREIERHKTTLIFCNTRSLAELIFQDLWTANEQHLPIGIHHGSLSIEARRKVEAAVSDGRIRALVCTASLDLGVDWGDVDLVIQMGAPKGSSRLLQRIGRANHRLDEQSQAILVPGNRFEYLEARAALDAIDDGELDPEIFRPGALDVLAQHVMAAACAGPFSEAEMLDEVHSAAPYAGLSAELFGQVLSYIENGGYSLRAYDRFRRLSREADGTWRVAHPRFIQQHRMNAGIIVDAPLLDVRFRNGRKLGTVEEYFASTLSPGDTFYFAGLVLEVERIDGTDLFVRASSKSARIPTYVGARMAMSTNLADRVRHFLCDRSQWSRFPEDVRDWLDVQGYRSILPQPDQLLVETFPHEHRHYMVAYSFEGWNAHQSLGMLITRRMESAGLKPLGFVSNDYALACYGLEPIPDPAALFSPDILEDEFVEWVQGSNLLKRAFREVAMIGGLVERHHPGKRKTGKQVTFSTDLIYDVLRRYEPDHLLLRAAWEDARTRLTDVGRLARLLDRAQETMVHVELDRVSPMAVPVLVIVGREATSTGHSEDSLLIEAESLAAMAMRRD
ncbi:ligase-associated DNA damage response DEXH box helicase [Sphingosinicella sp. BN140058]|uniref:ligase-associated DNA damage response DEXH box helicase n=1 Tax=Sphingosinicella sp. BN140058 TaxID=1892855 RepID=UPI001012D35B|nr:ligase-associated DNA damage response DEXH box helicase [Sphingosinicella sp. BN140058]QAY77140.1 ligase-associated DNA damage response DEXH box helicase [Sphingosinicella sp. BN140058]